MMLASFLEKDLAEEIKSDSVGVFYLGDLDSFVLASSASQVRKNVTLYVFTLDGEESDYVENAERVADLMGWSNNTVDINQSGTGEHYLDLQVGSGNYAHDIDISQTGTGNHAGRIELDGYSTDFDLLQQGSTDQNYSVDMTCGTSAGCTLSTTQGN